jgi:hypothetical protein
MPLRSDLLRDLRLVPNACPGFSHPMQDPLAEQVQLGAPVPQAFNQFDPAILPLTLACAPGCGQSGLDGLGILAKAPGDRLKRRQFRGFRRLQPWLKRGQIALGEEGLKADLELVPLASRGLTHRNASRVSRSASVKRPAGCRISRER